MVKSRCEFQIKFNVITIFYTLLYINISNTNIPITYVKLYYITMCTYSKIVGDLRIYAIF